MSEPVVRYERVGGVAEIVLDLPPLNAYDENMRWELQEARCVRRSVR